MPIPQHRIVISQEGHRRVKEFVEATRAFEAAREEKVLAEVKMNRAHDEMEDKFRNLRESIKSSDIYPTPLFYALNSEEGLLLQEDMEMMPSIITINAIESEDTSALWRSWYEHMSKTSSKSIRLIVDIEDLDEFRAKALVYEPGFQDMMEAALSTSINQTLKGAEDFKNPFSDVRVVIDDITDITNKDV